MDAVMAFQTRPGAVGVDLRLLVHVVEDAVRGGAAGLDARVDARQLAHRIGDGREQGVELQQRFHLEGMIGHADAEQVRLPLETR